MSTNNYIYIDRKILKAYHGDADCGHTEKDLVARGKTLDEVIDNVNKWEEERIKEDGFFEVEYGIRFDKR